MIELFRAQKNIHSHPNLRMENRRRNRMKKSLVVMAAIAIVIAMVSGAWASGSATVNAKAKVVDVCVLSGTADIDFGSLDANTNAAGVPNIGLTNAASMSLWCTNGAAVTISMDNGAHWDGVASTRRLSDAGTGYIAYTLAGTTAMTGGGKSSNLISAWDLQGSIPAGALDNSPAGNYTDSVLVTVAP